MCGDVQGCLLVQSLQPIIYWYTHLKKILHTDISSNSVIVPFFEFEPNIANNNLILFLGRFFSRVNFCHDFSSEKVHWYVLFDYHLFGLQFLSKMTGDLYFSFFVFIILDSSLRSTITIGVDQF